MPAGGARNAVDCALWELEAARAGVPVWQLAGQSSPKPLRTTFTLGADDPEIMAKGALAYSDAPFDQGQADRRIGTGYRQG